MAKVKPGKLNNGHYLEVMDRLYIMASNLEDYILLHPVVNKDKKLHKGLDQAQTLLLNAYQRVGGNMYKDLYKKKDKGESKKNK